ncbi:hypothetical protein BKI52_23565 [marine bacterium AO1-C]|nr:hypothetical protein BKI52_23565 [marine bacterium AO1-C]
MNKPLFKKLLLLISLISTVWVLQASQYTSSQQSNYKGYIISGKNIRFVYPSPKPVGQVYVVGNFMGWKKQHPAWKMRYDASKKAYILTVPLNKVKQSSRSFYEFTFLVNNRYVDAVKKAPNVIHCAGYGYRYVIREL